MPFDHIRGGKHYLRPLGGAIHQWTVESRSLRSGGLGFRGRVSLDLVAVEEGPHLPPLHSVEYLSRGLILEHDLKPAHVRALLFEDVWQRMIRLAARVDLAGDDKGLGIVPGCKTAARSGVAGDDLPAAHVGGGGPRRADGGQGCKTGGTSGNGI